MGKQIGITRFCENMLPQNPVPVGRYPTISDLQAVALMLHSLLYGSYIMAIVEMSNPICGDHRPPFGQPPTLKRSRLRTDFMVLDAFDSRERVNHDLQVGSYVEVI